MAQYTTKRKYTKKPTTKLKKVVKVIKRETVEVEPITQEPVNKPAWQKFVSWFKF
jgi:hypothetical protein